MANQLCNTIVYHLLRCHPGKFPGKFCIFLVLLIIDKKICRDGVSDCKELYCTHGGVDIRIILHAIHADKTFGERGIKGRIIVKSPNTDFLILYASITFLQCNIHRNAGFIRVLSQTPRTFPYIRSVASSILFYVTFYQLHMPSQDVIPHHPCSGLVNEPFLKYLKTVTKH